MDFRLLDGNFSKFNDMASSIKIRQNLLENLELLAAQRQLYSDSKRWMNLRLYFSLILLAMPLLANWIPELEAVEGVSYLIFVGFFSVSYLYIKPKERNMVETAAKIQEKFDYRVFGISEEELYKDKGFINSTFDEAKKKYMKKNGIKTREGLEKSDLVNWYSVPDIEDNNRQALFCQKSNLLWDFKQRKYYMKIFLFLSLATIFVPLAISYFIPGFTVKDFVQKIFFFTAPFSFLCYENYSHHKEIVEQQEQKTMLLENMLELKKAVSNEFLLYTQETIFANRKKNTLVPDWLYRKKREESETRMKKEAKEIK